MAAKNFSDVIVSVGTKKGLFLFHSDKKRQQWRMTGPYLNGSEINHATVDPRDGSIYATAFTFWFGPQVAYSRDMGETWKDAPGSPRFAPDSGLTMERLWRVEPGRPSEPNTLYCGVAPAALFRSDDKGEHWQEVTALTQHPTRGNWAPSAGGLALHSIVLDPANPQRMWIAISAAGVFRTDDGGASWQPMNASLKNVMAKYAPEAEVYTEVGQCVHHIVRAPGGSDRLYAQTHWGTYRTDNGADAWDEITEGLPSDYGFVMAAHPRRPDTAYVVPLQGGEFRCPPEGKLRVYRTDDAGKSWRPLCEGLPQKDVYLGALREGLAIDQLDPAGLYLGSNTGQLYASADEGETWRRLTVDLPPISSVNVTVLN